MSGSGKTTIGKKLVSGMSSGCQRPVLVDGDVVRNLWGDNLGYTVKDREINAKRVSHLCNFLDQQGLDVVGCVLSIFPHWQAWNRETFSSYFEIFVDTPMHLLEERDTKALYSRAKMGIIKNVVGVDIKFPYPPNPDLTISNSGVLDSIDELADEILGHILEKNSRKVSNNVPA